VFIQIQCSAVQKFQKYEYIVAKEVEIQLGK